MGVLLFQQKQKGSTSLKYYTSKEIIEKIQSHWPEVCTPAHEMAVHLHRVRDLSFARTCETLKEFGLSVSEFDILATVRRSPQPYILTPTELQCSLLITSGGLTKLLHQLEFEGLISRSVDKKDKRSKLVHLTGKGKKTVELAMDAVHKTLDVWLNEAFNEGELEQLKILLGKAASALERE